MILYEKCTSKPLFGMGWLFCNLSTFLEWRTCSELMMQLPVMSRHMFLAYCCVYWCGFYEGLCISRLPVGT